MVTALGLGIPALLGEGLTWSDIRPPRRNQDSERAADDPAKRDPAKRILVNRSAGARGRTGAASRRAPVATA